MSIPGSSREHPLLRPTARVFLLGPGGRTLLFTVSEPDIETGRPFWFPPGGGVEPGETHEEAAVRELFEETGLTLPIEPALYRRRHIVEMKGTWWDVEERYFVARHDSLAIGRDHVFVPRDLPFLFPDILAGRLPAAPQDVE